MKTRTLTIIAFLCFTLTAMTQSQYYIDKDKTTLQWEGYYQFYFGGHEGTVDFTEGFISMLNDDIVGGYFTVDMTTLVNTDGGYNEGLTNHLKDPDFFHVSKYPEASLNITEVIYHTREKVNVRADLTIKGITNAVNFNADIDYDKKSLSTQFKIDRTLWGITYGSKLKDNALSDAMGFIVNLVFE